MRRKRMVIQILGASSPGVMGSVKVMARHLTRDPLVHRMWLERNSPDDLVNLHLVSADPENIWHRLNILLHRLPRIRLELENHWIVICEGDRGWNDYRVLAHADRRVRLHGDAPGWRGTPSAQAEQRAG